MVANGGRKTPCAGGIRVRRAAAGEVENLSVPEPPGSGTGAIRRELLINSHLSAPQTPGLMPCVCPGPDGPGMLRFSHLPADARRTRMPPAQGVFLFVGSGYFNSFVKTPILFREAVCVEVLLGYRKPPYRFSHTAAHVRLFIK